MKQSKFLILSMQKHQKDSFIQSEAWSFAGNGWKRLLRTVHQWEFLRTLQLLNWLRDSLKSIFTMSMTLYLPVTMH